ncbi:putative AAA family ATPase [Pyronema domesticum]|uniref:Similar to ATPase WRNIP1 homolog C26H5.02c acc. no. O13984 n=1 Tax=Pyronema omphalodes (strain CBS 100304) TaxID=1076935 RepID=U4LUS9_PYROM|nr:putative AAA family ATPase [Pyronema domesticum]CCX33977.1 Similar to ATPase WRNIP1 homolog C26H5.02c; acc. no. O13984 [Pyronema omphalodes CBS 100304]
MALVPCPICSKEIPMHAINKHLDSNCSTESETPTSSAEPPKTPKTPRTPKTPKAPLASIFTSRKSSVAIVPTPPPLRSKAETQFPRPSPRLEKRGFEDEDVKQDAPVHHQQQPPPTKRLKASDVLRGAMPLAEKMRPMSLDEVCGQDLVGKGGVLRGLIEEGRVPSMILWGSPGCGKTTIARVISNVSKARFIELSATASGIPEFKKVFQEARSELLLTGKKTILFVDEIHRLNKTQQDAFLAPVEKGEITLIGATTENPSFKVQSALLSRCRTFTLTKLSQSSIEAILRRALSSESPDHPKLSPLLDDELLSHLALFSDGDARSALNLLELSLSLCTQPNITKSRLKQSLTKTLVYDRSGDMHYDHISAFHKSIRGSCADAALFWLGRMLAGGEDPLFIARRMVVIASEDVGLADNSMLSLATATVLAVQQVGLPEARINLAHCATALALARKSTRAYKAYGKVVGLLEGDPGMAGAPVPLHLRNAPTRLMEELDYGRGYKYNPDYREGRVKQEYLPKELGGIRFLDDNDLGDRVDPDLEDEEDSEYNCAL